MFYRSLFPYDAYFRWLNYGTTPSQNFTHREFSFTLNNDRYLRFNSYDNQESLRKDIERFQPVKIDIGAIYAVRPRDKATVSELSFKAHAKEFVIDIDLTDYDEIRTCCSGGDICNKCWQYAAIGMDIIHTELKEQFGFEHILWVYSGRRGVHCWVCDESARNLDDSGRKAIIGALEVVRGGVNAGRKVRIQIPIWPSLERSFNILDKYFESVLLDDMQILSNPSTSKAILDLVRFPDVKDKIQDKWIEKDRVWTSKEKWEYLVSEVGKMERKKRFREDCAMEIKFQHCYPRLDTKVSTDIKHLLKSPFCVHPKTLKVCVPIRPSEFHTFDPLSAPDMITLRKELMAYNKEHPTSPGNYTNTSLAPYISYFEEFLSKF
ncbi:hypothetical protein BDF20DRAFT_824673 [Mycotypha africana]|uniref:uncharacterized protein n=1 Tax=Mycotypha africana TaxID=64632 RepID=UPI0023001130|nr:uncharacterized protein BDF20DRAFT_824673 [Mycotypha africana]KAI8971782.1 hypothetical protein BDF20DRAFT_824673 [Mycotypha africana]